jgi:predicted transcriptional regulator/DNA-binding XRE family transcriptional regulator
MSDVPQEWADEGSFRLDPLVFGRRVRHIRNERGLTLRQLAARVGKHAPYLSQLENGKRNASLDFVNALARALGVGPADLLAPEAPSRRAGLELALERVQNDPLWQEHLGLPRLSVSSKTPTALVETVVRLFEEVRYRGRVKSETPEGARRANAWLRALMRERDNYFPEIEKEASRALKAAGYTGGPVSQRLVLAIANVFGLAVHPVRDLPASTRSVTDLRNHRVYIPQRDRFGSRVAISVVVQALGHLALQHEEPRDFGEFLRQRVETNYFAGAVLIPEESAVSLLRAAHARGDLSVEDLEERFSVSYEMAAHRFTNLATRRLGLPVHFVRSDDAGVIGKAYENDDIPLPADADGAIEGQLLCKYWGARRVFGSDVKYALHYQYTDMPQGTYFDVSYIEAGRQSPHAITVGASLDDARFFRGSDSKRRARSNCPTGECCRRPPRRLSEDWEGRAWPSPRPHSHVLAALPAGTFPGVDLSEVYEFLDRYRPQ